MKYVISIFLLLLISSCSSVKVFEAGNAGKLSSAGSEFDGQATVYAFREGTSSGAMWAINVGLDKNNVGSVRRNTYIKFAVPPGEHTIKYIWPPTVSFPDIGVKAHFEAGKTYYFLYNSDFELNRMSFTDADVTLSSHIQQLTKAEASAKIAYFKNRTD